MSSTQASTEIHELSRAAIGKGSRSFGLASKLFDAELRSAASLLYMWCRHCDDQIDGCEPAVGKTKLVSLVNHTRAAHSAGSLETLETPFTALGMIVRKYAIPEQYAHDLLRGFEMDLDGTTYPSLRDLRLYCYRVAGAVGNMMTHILGSSSAFALEHAAEMGVAMQLTNIARDVREDLRLGRLYLPTDWLRLEGVDTSCLTEQSLEDPVTRNRVFRVVTKLLLTAEASYAKGSRGLRYLPVRGILAVAAAAYIYREIGRRLLARGPDALLTRTVVPLHTKIGCVVRALASVAPLLMSRIARPWRRAPLPARWTFTA